VKKAKKLLLKLSSMTTGKKQMAFNVEGLKRDH